MLAISCRSSALSRSQVADPSVEDGIVVALAAGVLFTRITMACCAGRAGCAWLPPVSFAIFAYVVSIRAPRNPGNHIAARYVRNSLAAAIASTAGMEGLFSTESWHVHGNPPVADRPMTSFDASCQLLTGRNMAPS